MYTLYLFITWISLPVVKNIPPPPLSPSVDSYHYVEGLLHLIDYYVVNSKHITISYINLYKIFPLLRHRKTLNPGITLQKFWLYIYMHVMSSKFNILLSNRGAHPQCAGPWSCLRYKINVSPRGPLGIIAPRDRSHLYTSYINVDMHELKPSIKCVFMYTDLDWIV